MQTDKSPRSQSPPRREIQAELFDVVLKGGRPWGLTMGGGSEIKQPLCVTHIESGGKAARNGTLQVGDVIISINDVDCHLLSEAAQLVYSAFRTLTFTIWRENMPSHFKVKEYCPMVFRNLRERFGVDDLDYLNSLTKQAVDIDSSGRSGARMMLTQDKRFFVKSLVSEEVEQMHHVMKQYHQYIVECHAVTLLSQYMGMYRITVNDVETYLVVMRNVFSPRLAIHKKYDLKGSTVDRQASDKEKSKDLPTYKDNDFVSDQAMIHIGAEEKERLMMTLTSDVEFLKTLHLMDYSLIVGIHDCQRAEKEALETRNCVPDNATMTEEELEEVDEENGIEETDDMEGVDAVPTPPDSPQASLVQPFDGKIDPLWEKYAIKSSPDREHEEVYCMALIDILTKYGMKKRAAEAAKNLKHGTGAEISTVKPEQYASRFLDFISKCIE